MDLIYRILFFLFLLLFSYIVAYFKFQGEVSFILLYYFFLFTYFVYYLFIYLMAASLVFKFLLIFISKIFKFKSLSLFLVLFVFSYIDWVFTYTFLISWFSVNGLYLDFLSFLFSGVIVCLTCHVRAQPMDNDFFVFFWLLSCLLFALIPGMRLIVVGSFNLVCMGFCLILYTRVFFLFFLLTCCLLYFSVNFV